MKKGDILEGKITKYDFPNKGSLVIENKKIVIKGALIGQTVRFMVAKKKSGLIQGRLLEVLEKSPLEDIEPPCEYFGQCGGCTYQNLSYQNQLNLKEGIVKDILSKVVENLDDCWEGIIGSPIQSEYRNKMEFTFGDEYKDGPLALGLHKKGSFHDILRISGCKIVTRDWSKIMDYTLGFFSEMEVPYFHRMRHEGILRNLVVRQSSATGEFLINLVTTTQWEKYGFDKFADIEESGGPSLSEMAEKYVDGLVALQAKEDFAGKVAGILYTENDALGDVVKSDKMICLYGNEYITEKLNCGNGEPLSFTISPFSFFQTNTKGCEVLYAKAREYIMGVGVEAGEKAGARNDEKTDPGVAVEAGSENGEKLRGKVVFDLYSGTGTIAQMMSKVSGKVIGIEIVEEAVLAAKENAKLNGLNNCEFIAGDVLKAIDYVEESPDMIILDPPRDGINPKALDKIIAFGVEEIVYISCKPTSLARDLEVLQNRGYKVKRACAIDQFPSTGHVETVVLLSQQKPSDRIEVELDLDELDATSAETKATYAEIKDYVLKEHGLKVSNLYISQVRIKCGLEVGENYNLAMPEGTRGPVDLCSARTEAVAKTAKQPNCPEEKKKAIVDALEHFGMI